jgi:aminopeptidase N
MDSIRLPSYIKPTNYDLAIQYTIGSSTFTGTVTISIALERETEAIYLHANKNLQITAVFLGETNLEHSYFNEDTIAIVLP